MMYLKRRDILVYKIVTTSFLSKWLYRWLWETIYVIWVLYHQTIEQGSLLPSTLSSNKGRITPHTSWEKIQMKTSTWSIVSPSHLHKVQIPGPYLALFCRTSHIKTLFVRANHIKIMDFIEDLTFQIFPTTKVLLLLHHQR